MGKIFDLMMSGSWEEYQRIQLYKKVGKKLEEPKKEKTISRIAGILLGEEE